MTLKCLPPLPWSIPDREYEVRKDLRGERVFTIDPPNAKDLDDALSIKANMDGTYTVGVHIADVSYFRKHMAHETQSSSAYDSSEIQYGFGP